MFQQFAQSTFSGLHESTHSVHKVPQSEFQQFAESFAESKVLSANLLKVFVSTVPAELHVTFTWIVDAAVNCSSEILWGFWCPEEGHAGNFCTQQSREKMNRTLMPTLLNWWKHDKEQHPLSSATRFLQQCCVFIVEMCKVCWDNTWFAHVTATKNIFLGLNFLNSPCSELTPLSFDKNTNNHDKHSPHGTHVLFIFPQIVECTPIHILTGLSWSRAPLWLCLCLVTCTLDPVLLSLHPQAQSLCDHCTLKLSHCANTGCTESGFWKSGVRQVHHHRWCSRYRWWTLPCFGHAQTTFERIVTGSPWLLLLSFLFVTATIDMSSWRQERRPMRFHQYLSYNQTEFILIDHHCIKSPSQKKILTSCCFLLLYILPETTIDHGERNELHDDCARDWELGGIETYGKLRASGRFNPVSTVSRPQMDCQKQQQCPLLTLWAHSSLSGRTHLQTFWTCTPKQGSLWLSHYHRSI